MQTKTLPDTGFLRLPQVLQIIPISKSGWWAGVKSGKYPKSIKHGGATFWRAEDIRELIEKIAQG
ncbi:MAG: helix-turn-helix transcriptional regulator [Methylophilaceae bacterium]